MRSHISVKESTFNHIPDWYPVTSDELKCYFTIPVIAVTATAN